MTIRDFLEVIETTKPIMTFAFDSGGHEYWFDLDDCYGCEREAYLDKKIDKIIVDDDYGQIDIYYDRLR